jgi:diguanylate cyclase (GGDEF)-like protein
VVLFPATRLEQAIAASEKICALVREYAWSALEPALKVTISAGVAAAEGHASHEKLLSEADRRLYAAKAGGKDRVVATPG